MRGPRYVDWRKLLLMLRKRGVPTTHVWRKNGLKRSTVETLVHRTQRETYHATGEVIIREWLMAGGKREDIPYLGQAASQD